METLEIVRDAYNAACAELEKSQKECSKLEALLHDILETLPVEFIGDVIDLKTLDKPAIRLLRKYISLAISVSRELSNHPRN